MRSRRSASWSCCASSAGALFSDCLPDAMSWAYMVAGVSLHLYKCGLKEKARHSLAGPFVLSLLLLNAYERTTRTPKWVSSPVTSHQSRFLVNCPWTFRAKAFAFRLRLRIQWRGHRLLLQRMFEHFVKRVHVGDLDIAKNLRRQISHHVRLVVRRQQNFFDACALGSKHFFLHSANRRHHAGKRHFSGHGQAVLHCPPAEQADQCGYHRRARGRTVLRHCARRHVDVDVLLAEEVRI